MPGSGSISSCGIRKPRAFEPLPLPTARCPAHCLIDLEKDPGAEAAAPRLFSAPAPGVWISDFGFQISDSGSTVRLRGGCPVYIPGGMVVTARLESCLARG